MGSLGSLGPSCGRARLLFSTGKVDMFLTLTTSCNYRCVFCSRDGPAQVLRLAEIPSLPMLVARARFVDITGYGEVTTHPDLEQVLRYFSERRVPIRIVTNGSRLTERVIDLLCKASMHEVVVSLNSLDGDTYSLLHGRGARLDNVVNGVRELIRRRPAFPVRLSFVLTAKNFGEIPRFIDFAKEVGAASVACLGLTPTLTHLYTPELEIPNTPENRAFLAEMGRYARSTGVNAWFPDLDNQATTSAPIPPERLRQVIRGCDWVYTKAFVEQDGTVRPCCWSRMDMGNVKTQAFDQIWRGAAYRELRAGVRRGYHPACEKCRRLN